MKRPSARRPGEGHHFVRGVCTRCSVRSTDRAVRLICPTGVVYKFDKGPQGYFDFEAARILASIWR